MSRLITRCPECQTMFRVVPDQLRMSEGWARCGQCQTAFDAAAHLQSPAAAALPSTALPIPVPVSASVEVAAPPVYASERSSEAAAAPLSSTATPQEWQTPEQVAAHDPVDLLLTDLSLEGQSPSDPVDTLAQMSGSNADPPDAPSHALHDVPPDEPSAQMSAADSALFALPVAASVQPPLSWPRRLAWAGLLVLILALALQILLHERLRVLAVAPVLRPALLALCERGGCTLGLPRQADAVQLDSASFIKVRDGVYRLNLTLRNTARWDLALPAIELTLTDAEDRPILRRVLRDSELDLSDPRLPAGAEVPVSLLLGLEAGELASRVVGYHALAFYL